MEKPLVNKKEQLQKFPGKGGWTFVAIPEVLQDKTSPFGWVTVKGSIDDYAIKNYKLQPMGNGKLFLPVKAQIRKIIQKQAGDFVQVILYKEDAPIEIPSELKSCLLDEPNAYEKFTAYTQGQQKEFIDWIYAPKKVETKVARIVIVINKVLKNERLRTKQKV